MKTKVFAIILIVLIINTLIGCSQSSYPIEHYSLELPESNTENDVKFELLTNELPDRSDIVVYKVNNLSISKNVVEEAGKILGFTGDTGLIDRGTKLAMINETEDRVTQFSVWLKSGAMEYALLKPDNLFPKNKPNLPTDQDAKDIAVNYLKNSKLWPADADINNVEVVVGGQVQEIDTKENIEKTAYDAHLLVRVKQTIGGYPTVGPGTKFGVRVGDQGEIIKFIKCWRDVEPHKIAVLKPAATAFEDFITGSATSIIPAVCKEVVITDVSLAYWLEGVDEAQEFALPVYVFRGQCYDDKGVVLPEPFEGYCKALVE